MPSQKLVSHLLAEAKALADTAQAEGRKMSGAEQQRANEALDSVQQIADTEEYAAALDGGGEWTVGAKRARDRFTAQQAQRDRDMKKMHDMMGGSNAAFGLAYAAKAAGLDLRSNPSVSVSLADAIGLKATTVPAVEDWNVAQPDQVHAIGQDTRYLHQVFPVTSVSNESAIADFVQTGSRTVSGQIERELDALTEKATLSVTINAVVTKLKQYALVVPSLPNAVLESMVGLRQFLDAELTHQIRIRLDQAIVAAIYAASPQTELTGGDLVARVRNAVALMRSEGANPTILAVSPDSGASLDLQVQPGDSGDYIFTSRGAGSASPIWNLRVVETPGLTNWPAMVLDPALLGTLYLGGLRIDLDPYSEFTKNLSTVRCEAHALMHVRQVDGVCLLESGS